jgi:hypothetical protein
MKSKGTMPTAYRKDALIIFILLALTFAYFYQGGGSNENSRFSLIFSSIQESRLSIDDFYNKADTYTIDNAYFNGHYYSDKAIGPAILGAVFYAPLSWMQKNFNYPSQADVKWILTFLVVGLPAVYTYPKAVYRHIWLLWQSHWEHYIFRSVSSFSVTNSLPPCSLAPL